MSDFSAELETTRSELVRHLRSHALRTDGPFVLRSGRTTSWYLDARRTTYDGEGAVVIGRLLVGVLDPQVEASGGMTMGADPMAIAAAVVAQASGRRLRAFSVRKEMKGHGMAGRLVGPVEAGDRVAVLEDTTTTGGALLEAVQVVEEAGLQVVQAVALADRSDGLVSERLAGLRVPYVALVVPKDLGVDPHS